VCMCVCVFVCLFVFVWGGGGRRDGGRVRRVYIGLGGKTGTHGRMGGREDRNVGVIVICLLLFLMHVWILDIHFIMKRG